MRKVVFIPDMHGRMLHMPSWRLVLEFVKDFQPDRVVQLGDIIDNSGVGKFPIRSQDMVPLRSEFDFVNQRLDELEATGYPVTDITEGNHEERLRRPGAIAESLESVADPRHWLCIEDRQIQWIPYTHDIRRGTLRLGNLRAGHGFYTNKYAAAYHAEAFGNYVFGHTHRVQILPAGRFVGHAVGFNVGWLGQKGEWVLRQSPRGWSNAFGFAYIHRSGKFQMYIAELFGQNITINNKTYTRR